MSKITKENQERHMNMVLKIKKGEYQIGIYNVRKETRRKWVATATGPGTIGDGSPRDFPTFREAYEAITDEPLSN